MTRRQSLMPFLLCIGSLGAEPAALQPPAIQPGAIRDHASPIEAEIHLALPAQLHLSGFLITEIHYAPGSTKAKASGTGKTSFDQGPSFSISFKDVVIEAGLAAKSGTISAGRAETAGLHGVALPCEFPARVKALRLQAGVAPRVDLQLLLPTLYTLGAEGPARQARLDVPDVEATQALDDIYLEGFSQHQLGLLGVGDTEMLINASGAALTLDLSPKKSPGNLPAGATGIVFNKLVTQPQPSLTHRNTGFCFAKYESTHAGLGPKGLIAHFELSENWPYAMSLPEGYEATLQAKAYTVSGSAKQEASQATGLSQPSPLLPLPGLHLKVGKERNPALGGLSKDLAAQLHEAGGKLDASKLVPIEPEAQAPLGVLNLVNSQIRGGRFKALLAFPKIVSTLQGARVVTANVDLFVDGRLNTYALVPEKGGICWGACENNPQLSYGLLPTWQPGFGFFPGPYQSRYHWTKQDPATGEELFNTAAPAKPFIHPGVTFNFFTLGLATRDARLPQYGNLNAILVPSLLPPLIEAYMKKAMDRFLYPFKGETWLNVGAAGVGGKLEIESALGYHDYALSLGNQDGPSPKPAFRSFLHALPDPQNPLPLYEHFYEAFYATGSTSTQPIWGHFCQASFVDSAVFDLGLDGHFEVAGPSKLVGGMADLSATSTGDLASSRVIIDGKLDYWGVGIQTEHSRMVPRVDEVFLLGSQITEKVHYLEPFPVVWGEMTGDGNLPSLIFGYGPSTSTRSPSTTAAWPFRSTTPPRRTPRSRAPSKPPACAPSPSSTPRPRCSSATSTTSPTPRAIRSSPPTKGAPSPRIRPASPSSRPGATPPGAVPSSSSPAWPITMASRIRTASACPSTPPSPPP